MNNHRTGFLALLFLALGPAVGAGEKDRKGPEITDKMFRQTSSLFLDDPLNKLANYWARLIMLYSQQTSNAAVIFGKEELRWVALDRNDPRSLLLLAAYSVGNIQSQLNSGVNRSDRYSGVLTLFRVYRVLREQNKEYRVAAVDDLLSLHKEAKLVPHLQKLDAEKSVKLTPVEEEAIRQLMKVR
jgi:hypothetical protein